MLWTDRTIREAPMKRTLLGLLLLSGGCNVPVSQSPVEPPPVEAIEAASTPPRSEAVLALEKLGADFEFEDQVAVSLELPVATTNSDLARLKELTGLKRIVLPGAQITDGGLVYLRRWRG